MKPAADRQQPEGDGALSTVVAPTALLGIAKFGVFIIDGPTHVATETTKTGGAIGMSGLRPGAVAPDGTVASLKSGAATALGVSRGAGLPTKEFVSVESAVPAREAGSVMVAVGLQMLKIVLIPNGVVIGRGGTTEARTEGDEENIKPPLTGDDIMPAFVGAAFAAAALVGPMIPGAGHMMISPSDVPANGLSAPR